MAIHRRRGTNRTMTKEKNDQIGVYAVILAFISHIALALIFKSLLPFMFGAIYIIILFSIDDFNTFKARRKK